MLSNNLKFLRMCTSLEKTGDTLWKIQDPLDKIEDLLYS